MTPAEKSVAIDLFFVSLWGVLFWVGYYEALITAVVAYLAVLLLEIG